MLASVTICNDELVIKIVELIEFSDLGYLTIFLNLDSINFGRIRMLCSIAMLT